MLPGVSMSYVLGLREDHSGHSHVTHGGKVGSEPGLATFKSGKMTIILHGRTNFRAAAQIAVDSSLRLST